MKEKIFKLMSAVQLAQETGNQVPLLELATETLAELAEQADTMFQTTVKANNALVRIADLLERCERATDLEKKLRRNATYGKFKAKKKGRKK